MIAENLVTLDIKALLQTCKSFAESLRRTLLLSDVQNKECNALSFPKCCILQATPLRNRALCATLSPGSHDNSQSRRYDESHKDYNHYEFPVFPSKELLGRPLLSGAACSALALATKRNHLEVMKVLLQFGADTLEKHHAIEMKYIRRPGPIVYEDLPYEFPHHSVISYVSSLAAAKLLLDAGAGLHINNLCKIGYSPLEMVLYRYNNLVDGRRLYVTESELYSIVQTLLKHGASPRRVPGTRRLPYHASPDEHQEELRGGPLIASVLSRSSRILRLVLGRGSSNLSNSYAHSDAECLEILDMALEGGCLADVSTNYLLSQTDRRFRQDILTALLEAGLSPNHFYQDERLISWVIATKNLEAAEILMKWKVDTISTTRNLAIVSEVIFSSPTQYNVLTWSSYGAKEMIERLVHFGADINEPSLCSGPPLLLAACDAVNTDIFKLLLELGAQRSGFYQLLSDNNVVCPYSSVLQCLLLGQPKLGDGLDMKLFQKWSTLGLNKATIHKEGNKLGELLRRRREKLDAFFLPPMDHSLFYTQDGKTHIVTGQRKPFSAQRCQWQWIIFFHTMPRQSHHRLQRSPL
ncbi:Fc.00g059620.m01.CDS01 [Cosmosporella sp. VM-42]